jgi:predicted nucleotidyltransferase
MSRSEALTILRSHYAEIAARFGVASLALFGSVARDESASSSDVDVLVKFSGPATFDGYFDLKFYLEGLLGREVDLVTDKALRQELRPFIERDLLYVA